MFLFFRSFLIIFLVLLQWIAPLVHAHASETRALPTGLHVPGLEILSVKQTALCLSATTLFNSDVGGLIVSIDAGMNSDDAAIDADLVDMDACLPVSALLFTPLLHPVELSFSPPIFPLVANLWFTAHAPRAPPV